MSEPTKEALQSKLDLINARIENIELRAALGQYQHRDLMTEGQKVVDELNAKVAAEKAAAEAEGAPKE